MLGDARQGNETIGQLNSSFNTAPSLLSFLGCPVSKFMIRQFEHRLIRQN